jgi:hypothetical protein
MITQAELKEVLHYNPDTGVFTCNKTGESRGGHNFGLYLKIAIRAKLYRADQLAYLYMKGEWSNYIIDHINGIYDDNRWVNLRPANLR